MVRLNEIRENEVAVEPPAPDDAGLVFIGTIRTPWTSRLETPRQGRPMVRSAVSRSPNCGKPRSTG